MSHSAEFDASPAAKIHNSGSHLRKWSQHIARDLDDRSGTPRAHANKGIDRSRTINNETYIYDDQQQELIRATSVDQVVQSITDRISEHGGLTPSGKKAPALRDTSVVVRPLVLGLDADWFSEHNPDWQTNGLNDEARRLMDVQLRWAQDVFGAENLRAVSLHLDENRPQWQIAFVPMNETGQISQKSFFQGPQGLKNMHDDMRKVLRENGYDATPDRVTGKRSNQRFTDAEYKRQWEKVEARQAELDRAAERLADREGDLADREASFVRRVRSNDGKESGRVRAAAAREKELAAREAAVTARETAAEDAKTQIRGQFDLARQVLERAKKAARWAEQGPEAWGNVHVSNLTGTGTWTLEEAADFNQFYPVRMAEKSLNQAESQTLPAPSAPSRPASLPVDDGPSFGY